MTQAGAVAPAHLRKEWDELSACECAMSDALEGEDMEELARQTERRHQLIIRFFEDLLPAEPHSAPLRTELLHAILQRNQALLQASHQRLAQVGSASLQATHSRKAIGAYQAQEADRDEEH